jgi:hypothetical protein
MTGVNCRAADDDGGWGAAPARAASSSTLLLARRVDLLGGIRPPSSSAPLALVIGQSAKLWIGVWRASGEVLLRRFEELRGRPGWASDIDVGWLPQIDMWRRSATIRPPAPRLLRDPLRTMRADGVFQPLGSGARAPVFTSRF